MSLPFYSDESEPIHRKIYSSDLLESDNLVNVSVNYEIGKCIEWINYHEFSKIALQFPDSLLKDAANIATYLTMNTQKQIFILGDTSYGSCCVDEIAAEHASADAIIHFGHACLSPIQRLPVMYVFGEIPIDIADATCAFKKAFPDITSPVIIYYEVCYFYAIGQIVENLTEYENLIVTKLAYPNEECEMTLNDNEVRITKCQRHFIIPKTKDLKDYSIFYIGCENRTLTNVMLSLIKYKFQVYNPIKKTAETEIIDVNHFLRKRYYYIERTRDAGIIGILVGTLGVSDYIMIIKHLRDLIRAAGKKSYVLVVGKRNVAKLANFADIEIFVNVACMESTMVDCSGFYQPIITPYELEIALDAREWSDDYITDFTNLLPDSGRPIPVNKIAEVKQPDVSLITGRLRAVRLDPHNIAASVEANEESSALVARGEMPLCDIHHKAAGEFLKERHWKGLEQHLGETPVAEIHQGRKGIACEYEDERREQDE